MAQKKALTDEELLAQFETLDSKSPSKGSKQSKAAPKKAAGGASNEDDEALAELENLAKAKPTSRPNTPKLALNQRGATSNATPGSTPAGSARNSEDGKTGRSSVNAPRKSGESTRSYHQGLTPTSEEERLEDEKRAAEEKAAAAAPAAAGGGWGSWFGGITAQATAAATAAAKQAEQYAKEIQKNEEAQKWTEQLRGRVGDLKQYGGAIRSGALPTFTSIINTIAPPISSHERLQIHITHDLIGYPSLDPTIHAVFSRVMSQVEGGDLLVIQRGSESSQRRASDAGFRGGSSGWNDGPWWRDGAVKRDLGVVQGLKEGTKLARVSAEAYAKEFFDAKGGLEKAAEEATKVLSETNPVRSSDVFVAIQAIGYDIEDDLFQGPPEEKKVEGGPEDEKDTDSVVAFAIYLYDPIHGISFKSVSQAFPRKWVQWMDAENAGPEQQLPEEIVEIIQTGGVDPREWVAEWMEETVNLAMGVVAQRYVARRMGVGEGGIGRGKKRMEFEDAAAGEAARAGVL